VGQETNFLEYVLQKDYLGSQGSVPGQRLENKKIRIFAGFLIYHYQMAKEILVLKFCETHEIWRIPFCAWL